MSIMDLDGEDIDKIRKIIQDCGLRSNGEIMEAVWFGYLYGTRDGLLQGKAILENNHESAPF